MEVQERFQETLLGRTAFLITVKRNGEKAASRWITAEVAMIRRVVVPIHPLKRLQQIEQTDVTIHAVRLTRQGEHYAVRPEELIGKRMVRAVHTGTPITLGMVEEAPLIRQGDRVTLMVEVGGLRIMTRGRAKEDGFSGRQVAVLNLDSQKVVYGDVVDPSTVRIQFSND
jgi:flagella basal body P-ring formation protein FlgA